MAVFNYRLALAGARDTADVAEIVGGLEENKAVASDCIKVLYEIGYRNPALIAPYAKTFLGFLQSKNNRLVWGAMTALAYITELNPKPVFSRLSPGRFSISSRRLGVIELQDGMPQETVFITTSR